MGLFNKKSKKTQDNTDTTAEIMNDIEQDKIRSQEMINTDGAIDNEDDSPLPFEIAGNDISSINNSNKITKKIFKKKKNQDEEEQQLPDDLKQFGFVEMTGNIPSTDFEIIQDKKNFLGVFLNILKIIAACIIITFGIFCIYFSLSFKIIKENVRGANYEFNINNSTFSILSKNHTPNLDELKVGDKIVVIEEEDKSKYNPFILKYTKIEYTSRNGVQIFGIDPNGSSRRISSGDIAYVIPK